MSCTVYSRARAERSVYLVPEASPLVFRYAVTIETTVCEVGGVSNVAPVVIQKSRYRGLAIPSPLKGLGTRLVQSCH